MPAQLKPPTGLPSPSAQVEEKAWSSLIATQLADVRKSAENWRNGLLAMIGLVFAFSLIKGPDNVSGLDRKVAYAIGVLLLLVFACAIFGAWSALVAAYGKPSVITREDLRRLGGINGYKLEMAKNSASKLRQAQAAMLGTLLLLAIAVGLTWYSPRSSSTILDVERKSMPNVCGKLLSSEDGYMDIKPPASAAIRVYMTDVIKVRVVEECP